MKFPPGSCVMKNRMKRPLFALFLAFAASSLCGAELVERIVARVNDRLITQSEYDKRLAVAMRAPKAPDAPLPAPSQ